MLALRFFACSSCETVYADVTQPSVCDVCESERFAELDAEEQALSYFTRL